MATLSRREMLRNVLGGAAAFTLLPGCARAGRRDGDPAYGGFKMGVQTYSLRHYDLDGCLGHMKTLGLRYAQFYGGGKQMLITDDASKIAMFKEKLAAAGVQILSFGVERFTKDHEANKKKFDFARAMGFSVFTANPAADSFESLDKLTQEYGMKIAIHNHGPEDKVYGKLEQCVQATEKWPTAIGVCVDTGHVLRIGEDPVQWIKTLGPRVHDVHLKDASGPHTYHVVGKGKLDVLGTLKALKEVKFDGILALEYELKEKDPALIDDLKECLAAVREAVKKL